jgi:hypothetical protein
MTAEAFLAEELPSAEAFLDAAEPAPSMSAEAFLDTPLDEEPPAAAPVPTPFEERPTGMVALEPLPQAKPSPLPSPAEEQTASLSRDALADANAKRGIFSPDSAPYRLIGEQFAIDPLRYDQAAGELWKDGLIDSDQYYRMMNDAVEIKPAAQRRRALETQAGTNPELKAALYGFTKGAIQTAGAIGVGGAAGAGLAATGPGAIVGGIAAGTGTAMVLGDMVDTFAEKLAQENETIASLLAAKELFPGYDTAGQLASVVIPAPYAVSKLKTAASLIATERGAGEAAKFVARVTGTGAGIGAATDLAVQGGMAGVNLATGNPVDFSMESLAVSTALGGLTAGLGVRSQNKIYKPEELVGLERRALDGTASFEEFRDYSTMRAAVETLRKDDRLLSADAVRRATADFMGTPALDVTEIINPRFQQQALADAGLVLPYAAAPTAAPVAGSPVAYTGQAFLDRGGPAPAFQGGTNALPGPEGIPALPGPLPEAPAVNPQVNPTPAPLPESPTESTLLEAPIVEYPVANLKLSKDVPNFKENADPQTGVVKGEALQGQVDRRGMAPIVAWRRLNGDVEVISGRHRLDLFRRNQVGTIPTQIFNEADGFSIQDALTLDAELNIRDGQGTIKDYADYFRNSDIGEQQATQRGLLSRQKGISGFAIGKGGSDDLYAAFSAGKLSESKAAAIALAAPGDAEMQRVGMQFAKELSAPELTSFIAVNRRAKQPGAKQGDLFGNSDDNLNAAVALVKASRKRIGELDDQILSVKGAVKRPEAARKMGVDVNDPEAIRTRMVELEAQKEKYIRFFDHPEILAEVRALAFGEAAPIKPPTIATNGEGNLIAEGEMPFNLTSEPEPAPVAIEPVDEEAARRAAIRKAGEENTMSLFDAGPLPAAKSKGKSSGYADAGPLTATAPVAATAAKPDMATYSDAQIYADYPEAVGVVRTKGPGWTMPLILGGTDKVPVMEMPEIVEFYRSLVGQDPSVRNLRSLGLFNPASGNVSIRPDIFQNEQSALMTLAHEIGHVVSWMDERDIRLGNLGGHIMNVQKFLKGSFPLDGENIAVKDIKAELIGVSEWWKPIDHKRAPAPYVKYRHSAAELYADAVSVLFNSPADLEQRAPNFWKAFWNYADARPKVKASLFEIQSRIQNGRDAVLDKRLERDLDSFKAGRETFLRKHNAAQERRRSLTGWWESFKDQYWNRYQPLLESAAKARAAGKITPAEEDAYRWLTEEHPLADGKLQLHLADIGRLYQKLDEAGISRDLLGLSLKYQRIANERLDVMQQIDGEMVKVGETGRAVMANPGGETARTATEMLAKLRASMSPEQSAALDETLAGFRAVVFSVMEDANASGMFSPQLWETISNNRENYAAFTPLEYVEEYLPSAIKKQIGTFKEIADPLQQTVLKMISIHRAAQNNRFKLGVADMLREVAPELLTDAPMKYNGKAMVPQPPRDSDLALLQWKDGGQLQGIHIPKRYAAMFEDKSPAERDAILRFLATGFQRAVYGAIIRYNPAFQLFMSPARDLQRSLTNMPGGVKGRAKFLRNLLSPEAWGASLDWARGDIGRSALLREMVENAAVGGPHSAFGGKLQGDDDALVAILRKFHIQDQPTRNALLRAVTKPLHAIEFAGQVLQLLPKAAAYKVMVKDTGMPAPQAANTIRNHIGIPNYYKKGRNVSSAGALVPFLNIFLRSYESLYRNLSGKERNMGGKEWWIAWALTGGGLYAVMQTLAREGVFGEYLQRLYSRVPNWDMTNFGIVPLGEVSTGDTGGKTVYLRLPQDEGLRVINGTVAKLLQAGIRTAQGDPTAPKLGEVFDGISSQVPGVNPVVEVAQNWTTFLAGRNPRDDFRNKNILTEDQWLAGGWDAVKPMLGWTLGATGITNFFNYDPEADTLTEMAISSTPVFNRLLKISDRGVYQNEKAVDQADARDMAKARLSLPDFVQGLRTEFNYLKGRADRRSEREEDRYNELLLWNRSYRAAMEEVETSMEQGNRPSARDAIQTLIQESRDYRPAN